LSDSFYSRAADTGFSVLAYGGDPSGAADSTPAIAEALAAAVAAGGGYVVFGRGTWKFDTIVTPNLTPYANYAYVGGNVHFRFAGVGACILTPLNANSPLFEVTTVHPPTYPLTGAIRFEGGFTVRAHASGSTGPAINLDGARQWVIESPSYLDSTGGTGGSPGTYNSVIGLGIDTYGCRIVNPVCEGQQLGTCFIGSNDRTTVVANNNTIVNPLFEGNTATYMIDAAGTGELNLYDGIIEGNTVTAAIRLGNATRVRGVHFEANAAFAMDAHGADIVDPGNCWLENNAYNSGSGTLTIPAGVASGTNIIGGLGSLSVADSTGSYLNIVGSGLKAALAIVLRSPLAHAAVTSATTSGTVTLDPKSGDYQRIIPTANVTVGATTGDQSDGQDLVIEVTQPASGGPWTVGWSSQFIFAGSTTPVASATASAVDVFAFRYNATAGKWVEQYRRLSYFTSIQSGAAAGGDLSGTLPSPTVAKVNGVAIGNAPTLGYALIATGTSGASWQSFSGGVTLDSTATDIQPDGTQAAGSSGMAADAGHVHPGFFQQFTSSGSVTPAAGTYEITSVGAGGGGGGGGSASSVTAQAGGGGGGAGATSRQVVVLATAIALTVTIGAGGAGGAGAAANGAAGSGGTFGASTTVTGTGVSVTATGGSPGRHPTLNSNAGALGGSWGMGGINSTGMSTPGSGGLSAFGGSQSAGGPVDLAGGGGGGGGSANATTAGGGAGGAGTATAGGTTGTDAASGTTSGLSAAAATAIGAGGAGGGGGAQVTGTGGNGGAGGPGYATIRRVA
jgi:hypothetical protein